MKCRKARIEFGDSQGCFLHCVFPFGWWDELWVHFRFDESFDICSSEIRSPPRSGPFCTGATFVEDRDNKQTTHCHIAFDSSFAIAMHSNEIEPLLYDT